MSLIGALILKVYVSTLAQRWFTELVNSLMEKFNISFEKSQLYTHYLNSFLYIYLK